MKKLKNPLISWLIATTLVLAPPLAQHMNGGLLSVGITPASAAELTANKIQALLITSSGLYCALKNSKARNLNTKTDIKSIYHPAASIWSFNDIQRTMIKAAPDIIILQGSLLANNRKLPYKSVLLQNLKRYWITNFSQLHPLIESSLIKLQCTFDSLDHDLWMPQLIKSTSEKAQHHKNLQEQATFLKTLTSQNKPIIIVNQPYPSMAKNYMRTVTESVNRIVRDAGATESVTIVSSTSVYPDTFFYDPFHPKPMLSTDFTKWFHAQVEQLIE